MADAELKRAVEKAAKQANAHSFITSFPNGYNTSVGDSGTRTTHHLNRACFVSIIRSTLCGAHCYAESVKVPNCKAKSTNLKCPT